MKTKYLILLSVIALKSGIALAETSMAELGPVDAAPFETVPNVDINRYLGTWYEIESFPQSFQKDCTATTANYSLKRNGNVRVINTCNLKTLNGELKVAKGHAKIADHETQAKLRVSFFWPFYGDYWVLALGENYEYVLVGAPDRNYLWILSRTRTLSFDTIVMLRKKAQSMGFDISRLKTTLQPSLQALE